MQYVCAIHTRVYCCALLTVRTQAYTACNAGTSAAVHQFCLRSCRQCPPSSCSGMVHKWCAAVYIYCRWARSARHVRACTLGPELMQRISCTSNLNRTLTRTAHSTCPPAPLLRGLLISHTLHLTSHDREAHLRGIWAEHRLCPEREERALPPFTAAAWRSAPAVAPALCTRPQAFCRSADSSNCSPRHSATASRPLAGPSARRAEGGAEQRRQARPASGRYLQHTLYFVASSSAPRAAVKRRASQSKAPQEPLLLACSAQQSREIRPQAAPGVVLSSPGSWRQLAADAASAGATCDVAGDSRHVLPWKPMRHC